MPVEGVDVSEQSTAGAAATLQPEEWRRKSREAVVLGLGKIKENQHKKKGHK